MVISTDQSAPVTPPPRAMHTHHLEILHCTSPHYHVGLGNRNLPQIDKTFCQVLLVPPHKSTIVLSWHLKCPSCPHTDKVLCPEVYYARQTMHSFLALGRCVGRQGKVRDIVPSKIQNGTTTNDDALFFSMHPQHGFVSRPGFYS